MHFQSFQGVLVSFGLLSQAVAFQSPSSLPSIHWSNCPKRNTAGLDCGTIQVPIDYDNPDGDKVTLFIARLKARGASRLGSIVYNPGGPGGSASEEVFITAEDLADKGKSNLFSRELLGHYDLIGLDPRGVGQSSPVKCDPHIFNQRISIVPETEEEFNKLVNHNKVFSESCRNMTGSLIEHMDTKHVVKDIELVRQALNDGKLNFLGLSYGSLIGTAYAELYPENVGRMVLDGITDHSYSEIPAIVSETVTFELTLNKFFQWCNTAVDCALHGKDAAAIFDSVINAASTRPIPARGPRPDCSDTNPCRNDSNAEEILIAVKSLLASLDSWAVLSIALDQANQGNATLFSAPIFNEPAHPIFSALAIVAQDWTQNSKSFVDFALKKQLIQTLAPHTKGISQTWNLRVRANGWSAPTTNPQHILHDRIKNAPPILLVNSLWDPATSIDWANDVKTQIPKSVLIVRNGVGHTSYRTFNKTSLAMDNFLVNGILPQQGTLYES